MRQVMVEAIQLQSAQARRADLVIGSSLVMASGLFSETSKGMLQITGLPVWGCAYITCSDR